MSIVLLQFNGTGILSGPLHNDVGEINYLPGWFDYVPDGRGDIVSGSVWDPLYNQNHTFTGFVFVKDNSVLNDTDGFFQFHPEIFNPPTGVDQVYITAPLYSDPMHGGPTAAPEASTWLMLAMGLALLIVKTKRAARVKI